MNPLLELRRIPRFALPYHCGSPSETLQIPPVLHMFRASRDLFPASFAGQ